MANFLLTDKHTHLHTLTPTVPQKHKNIQTCVKKCDISRLSEGREKNGKQL